MKKVDEKDCLILNLLQKDCRMSLTNISKEVGLSIDSTKKRIKKMIEERIFYPKIQLRPRNFGFTNITDIRIKLHNSTIEEVERFIEFLKEHPRVAEILSLSGEWDLSIVILTRDAYDLGSITKEIRSRFSNIISSWSESLTVCAHKFEDYNMLKLMGYEK